MQVRTNCRMYKNANQPVGGSVGELFALEYVMLWVELLTFLRSDGFYLGPVSHTSTGYCCHLGNITSQQHQHLHTPYTILQSPLTQKDLCVSYPEAVQGVWL